jgi:hypothetical protein
MSQLPPKTLLKSRENLQAISKNKSPTGQYSGLLKYQVMDRVLLNLWPAIKASVEFGTKTKHIIDLNYRDPAFYGFLINEEFVAELIGVLKGEYPGVDFAYKETAGYDGKILERIIIMDWS